MATQEALAGTTRRELIDRYIVLDALEYLLCNVLDIPYDGNDLHSDGLQLGRVGWGTSAELVAQLWPDDDQLDGPECEFATARSSVLTAQLASRLSTRGREIAAISDRFSGLATATLAKVPS